MAARVVGAVVGFLVLGVVALLVFAGIGTEVGAGGLVVGSLLALLPVLPVALCFVWLDRWEPEPPRYLVLAFAWGATAAAAAALVVNTLAIAAMTAAVGEEEALVAGAVVVAPVVEEAAKGAFVLGVVLFRRREFDGVVDGIVLGGLAGVGFAFTENVLYFGRAFTEGLEVSGVSGGVAASVVIFVVRGIVSPFAHPLFTVMTGIGLGLAVMARRRWVRVVAPVGGFALAVVLHALWNASAVAGGQAFLALYVAVMIPAFATAVGLAVWSRRHEGAIVRRHLPAYAAAGWLAPYEVPLLSSLPVRRLVVQDARRLGGEAVEQATRDYHAAATELAFLRSRMLHGTAARDAEERQATLLDVLADRRRRAYVPPPPRSSPRLL